jgi:DNA-binding winged helix-turn-helix (wHTH) protein/TolB-like protein/Tfp pilus assembly protein PilF
MLRLPTGTKSRRGQYTEFVASLRFGAFELDLQREELRRGGVLLKLAPQQFRTLRYLAENAGRVCTREEIQRSIWDAETFVDFDRSLNVCIAQIRAALNDDAEGSRFIQTVPRRGYRFIAPVSSAEWRGPMACEVGPQLTRPPRWTWVTAAAAAVFLTAGAYAFRSFTPPRRMMIAVLPTELVGPASGPVNAPEARSAQAVTNGLLDDLIGELATAAPQRLAVIGRTSVMRYAGQKTGIREIGRELNADYAIESAVLGEGGRVRISARLVKTADQSVAWSEAFQSDAADGLDMQQEAAAHVTAGVVRTLFPGATAKSPARKAREAEPWAAMAAEQVGLGFSGRAPIANALEKARDAAQHALRIDEDNAEAHNALATVLFWRDWKWSGAGREFARALEINPSFAQARHDYAFYLIAMGHAEAGVASLRESVALDPLSPRINVDAGWVLLQAHHFEEAIERATRALQLEPGMKEAEACIARAEAYRGKSKPKMPSANSPFERAESHAMAGRAAEAMAALNEAYLQRDIMMPLIGTEPSFAALHADPRFAELLGKMGLGL